MSEAASAPSAASEANEPDVSALDNVLLDSNALPHELAAKAVENAAAVEKFFDDVLIDDFKATPLTNLDEVLDERKERAERLERLASRTKELLDEELAQEKHKQEVKDLEEAISITAVPAVDAKRGSSSGKGGSSGGSSKGSSGGNGSSSSAAAAPASAPAAADKDGRGSPDGTAADMPPAAPFKLISEGRKKPEVNNPYVLDMTEFMPEMDATRKARELRAENEALRACLKNGKAPKAFEQYLRRSSHTAV